VAENEPNTLNNRLMAVYNWQWSHWNHSVH